ncbi:MAG: glycosyltransferase [Candidatus Binatia bacterium]|nr:glycosyltransferase [Candidatus Binatia bacterium]
MNIFVGKKALCFIALPHHNRFLLPIMQALGSRGMEVVFVTAAAEAAFEITLNHAGLPYRHALDYATPEVEQHVSAAVRTLRPIWQEKVLTSQVLQAVPLPIQDKVIRSAIENVYCFARMLEVEKPDLLFALHELNPWGKILGYLSHVYRVPYITLQEGLYYGSTYYYRFHTDYSTACVVWGEATCRVLAAAGCSADKIFPLGNVDLWDARYLATRQETMAATRTALGIGVDKKVILFLMSHANYRSFEPSRFLNWLQTRGDVVAVFKWHPLTSADIIERALANLRRTPAIHSVQNFDTHTLLGISDICITVGNSTTGIEALVFGKPLIEIRLPDQQYSFAAEGVAELARGFEDLGEKVDALLTQGPSAERQRQVARYLADHFAFQDNKTVERIVEMGAEMLRVRAAPARAPLRSDPSPVFSDAPTSSFPCSLILPVNDTAAENVLATLKGIVAHIPPELFEILIVNTATTPELHALLSSLAGDVRIIIGEPEWSFATCCNQAAVVARGQYLVFLQPGFIPCPGWLEGLLATAAAHEDVGIVGGRVVNENGLLWHIGVAFDANNSPFSLYRLLLPEFVGTQKQREFRAVQLPFLVSRAVFCRLGGFDPDLVNRFEDIDFCLRAREAGLRVLYTPRSTLLRTGASWEPTPQQDHTNRLRFYTRWIGSLWQDDDRYLAEDGLDHDSLALLYKELAARISIGARAALAQLPE